MKDEVPTVRLVSIKIPGLEIEPRNPAWIICEYAGGLLNDLLSVELSASNLLSEPSTGGARQFPGTLPFAVEDVRAAADVAWGVRKRNAPFAAAVPSAADAAAPASFPASAAPGFAGLAAGTAA